ncbi:GALE-like protein [Mya arenaria]|uniref:UDP-glucose 4-epimerase n=1 Tax=Mya arenaria TaxID=6604 RepID=A0ABY7FTI1_MYAAR|nr:GALE-like protein [Mya arenaria]
MRPSHGVKAFSRNGSLSRRGRFVSTRPLYNIMSNTCRHGWKPSLFTVFTSVFIAFVADRKRQKTLDCKSEISYLSTRAILPSGVELVVSAIFMKNHSLAIKLCLDNSSASGWKTDNTEAWLRPIFNSWNDNGADMNTLILVSMWQQQSHGWMKRVSLQQILKYLNSNTSSTIQACNLTCLWLREVGEIVKLRPQMSVKGVLVTGAAGYVGTHAITELIQEGFKVIALDYRQDALTDAAARIKAVTGTEIQVFCVDLCDKHEIANVFQQVDVSHVLHLAGLKAVRQSHGSPLAFYNANVVATINLLEVMLEHGVCNILFSSSSKVYGTPSYLPLDETHPTGACTNPYGRTKYMVEEILRDTAASNQNFKVTVLRFFNPCGAHGSGLLGEDRSQPPQNLLPLICQVALGRRDHLTVYGSDYNTPDGTGIQPRNIKNLFYSGAGENVPVEFCGRKPGEIGACSADNSCAHRDLGTFNMFLHPY